MAQAGTRLELVGAVCMAMLCCAGAYASLAAANPASCCVICRDVHAYAFWYVC